MNLTPAEKQALNARDWPQPSKRQPGDTFTSTDSNRSLRPEAEADFDEPPASAFYTDVLGDSPAGVATGVSTRGMAMEAEDEGAGVPGSEAYEMTGAVDEGDDRGGSAAERDSDDL